MAKALIIKGADFSAVAVDHIVTEPQEGEYIDVAYIGYSFQGEARVPGAIYLFIQNTNKKWSTINESNQAVDYAMPDTSIVKYMGNYYKTSGIYLAPYYGVKSVGVQWADKGYKLTEGELSLTTEASFKHCDINAKEGETYYILIFDAAAITAVVKDVDGTYTQIADNSGTNGLWAKVEVNEDCILRVSHNPSSGTYANPMVAIER